MEAIKYEDFAKVDLRVATILEAVPIPEADKLVVLQVDLGDEKRQIVAGIKKYYKPEELIGKQIVIVANLEPRKLRGFESHGMLLAAVGNGIVHGVEDTSLLKDSLVLITTDSDMQPGTKVG